MDILMQETLGNTFSHLCAKCIRMSVDNSSTGWVLALASEKVDVHWPSFHEAVTSTATSTSPHSMPIRSRSWHLQARRKEEKESLLGTELLNGASMHKESSACKTSWTRKRFGVWGLGFGVLGFRLVVPAQ